ncbi:hypothetical protein D3C76_1880520 [compost metagenome]
MFARPLNQLGETLAHQQFGGIRWHLTARYKVKVSDRRRLGTLLNLPFAEQNLRQTVDVVGP